MNTPASPPERSPGSSSPHRRQLLVLSVAIGAVLLFIAIVILIYLGLRGTGQPSAGTPTPTEGVRPTATAPASPILAPSCEAILSSGNVEVSMALPISLTAGNAASYPVVPIVPQEDAWVYPQGRSGDGVWVCGTVVNYVIGLDPTAANEELVGNLAPGDEIRLQLSNGAVLLFRVAERRDVSPGAAAATSQQQPRLTLVLPKSDTWQIAIADYAAEAEPAEPPTTGASAQLGQPVEVDGVRVTVSEGTLERRGDLAQGTAYFIVEFTVENPGEQPLATETFSMRLRDSLGNTYLVSPQASEAGESGALTGQIQPGASAQGSAGYVVPDPLPTGEIAWIFSPRPGSQQVSVSIPHEYTGDAVALQPDVRVTDAFLSSDGSILIIEGEVQNRDTRPLVVEPSDVTLSSSAGVGELVTEAPPLPWTIQPGQLQVIELQYQRPEASTVLLELLGYSFEISGVQ